MYVSPMTTKLQIKSHRHDWSGTVGHSEFDVHLVALCILEGDVLAEHHVSDGLARNISEVLDGLFVQPHHREGLGRVPIVSVARVFHRLVCEGRNVALSIDKRVQEFGLTQRELLRVQPRNDEVASSSSASCTVGST